MRRPDAHPEIVDAPDQRSSTIKAPRPDRARHCADDRGEQWRCAWVSAASACRIVRRRHAVLLGSCFAACACALGRSEGPSGPGHCSAGDPIAGLFSRGRERDLPGSQATRPMPLPRSRTPAEPTFPHLLTVSSMLPPLFQQRRLQRDIYIGAIARLWHPLPTLQEWCCHPPCKARFRLAGSPLPGGS